MVSTAARPPGPAPSRAARTHVTLDAAVVAVVAFAVRLPAYLSARHLHFDDGVYGASAVAMRKGALPFVDVFSSQGPLHLPIVWLGDLLGGRTSYAPRTASLLGGVAATVLTYLIGRRITERAPALLAALAVATSGSVLWTTGPITADGPALAIALGAVLLAMVHREHPTTLRAALVGGLLGVALTVKAPLVLLATIPVAGLLLAGRRRADAVVAGASAVAVGLVASLAWGLGRVWDQSVTYQLDSERNASFARNLSKVFSTMWDRDLLLLVLASAALGFVIARRTAAGGTADPLMTRLLAAWLGAVILFLALEPALWRNHLAHLVAPASLLAACALAAPRALRVAVAAAVVAAPFHLASLGGVLSPDPYPEAEAAAVDALRALPEGALAISDEPGLVWRAGRATPPDLVDTSIKRIQQRRLTGAVVAREASAPDVCAVLVWSKRHFGTFDDLPARLAAEGYEVVARYPAERALYTRSDCEP